MYKVVLWGLGHGYDVFTYLHGHEMVDVVAVTDRECYFRKQIDGIPVVRVDELASMEFEYLIVTVVNNQVYQEIVRQAMKLGIARSKILPLRIFEIPFFNFDEYVKIKNSNVSILADGCLGGLLYHRFGLEMTSPTINMSIDNADYYRFLENLESYLTKDMVEVTDVVDNAYKGLFCFPRGR